MQRFHFSHEEIMNLPFKTFLAYQEAQAQVSNAEDPEVDKWRQEAAEWQKKNNPKG
jgi:hypothetical protein